MKSWLSVWVATVFFTLVLHPLSPDVLTYLVTDDEPVNLSEYPLELTRARPEQRLTTVVMNGDDSRFLTTLIPAFSRRGRRGRLP